MPPRTSGLVVKFAVVHDLGSSPVCAFGGTSFVHGTRAV